MTLKKYKLSTLSACVLLGLALSACGSDDKKPASTLSGVTSAVDTGSGLLTGKAELSDNNTFAPQTNVVTKYGSFSISATGDWSFLVNPNASEIKAATAGQMVSEIIAVKSADGHSYQITVSTQGEDDAPVFGSGDGQDSGTLDYANAQQVSGTLAISDPDANQGKFVAQSETQGYFGTFSIAENGQWQYALFEQAPKKINPASSSTYSRVDNNSIESFTVTSADGSTHQVAISLANHGEYRQLAHSGSFIFALDKGEASLADLLDTAKLSEILAGADITTSTIYEYNDDGDRISQKSFDSDGELYASRTWQHTLLANQYIQKYSYENLSGSGKRITDTTETWDLNSKTITDLLSRTASYNLDGVVTSVAETKREHTYTERGQIKQRFSKSKNSETGEYKPAVLMADYVYLENGDREKYQSYSTSTGKLSRETFYDAGLRTEYKSYDYRNDGALTSYTTYHYSGDQQVKRLSYKKLSGEFSYLEEALGSQHYLDSVSFIYRDELGRVDHDATVYYTEFGNIDSSKAVRVTQYIYHPSLQLDLRYSYYLSLKDNSHYYSFDDNFEPVTDSVDINITRYVTTKCGIDRQLSASMYALTAKVNACPITAPLPSKNALTEQAKVITTSLADAEAEVTRP